jgi:voltage-gated potassium channel
MERQESMKSTGTASKEEPEAPQNDIDEEDQQSQLDAFRLRLKKFMTTSRFGMAYTDSLLVLSIFSSLQFVYQTYLSHDKNEKELQFLVVVEKFIAGLFSFDWCLSFFMADHKSEFVNSFFSMVDLLTVVPIWITSGFQPVAYDEINSLFDFVLYMLYLLNTTRILRALRLHKKIMLIEDEVDQATANMILSVLVMLLFDAALLQYLEIHIQPLPFHTWMYAMWVTISTVGFGDISPSSEFGRVAIMLVIAFAIIQVPKMTNELLAKMALTSVYARLFYIPKKNSRHVIICGDLRSTEMREFFVELFHEDHDSSNTIAVIVQESKIWSIFDCNWMFHRSYVCCVTVTFYSSSWPVS